MQSPPASAARFARQPDTPQLGIDLFGGFLTDMAGIQNDEVGVFESVRLGEARRSERIRHPFGVVNIHLTPERLDKDFLRRRGRLTRARGSVVYQYCSHP